MMKALSFMAAMTLIMVAFTACNPDCKSIQGIGVNTKDVYNNYQFVITANPLTSLIGRKVFIGGVPAASEFKDGVGLIVTVPDKEALAPGPQEIKIEDPDCLDVFVIDDFQIVPEGYFNNLANYAPPIPPEIVIPSIPISFPASVDNAWLSPEDPGYCLWFIMYKDADGKPTALINPDSSFEQATCWCLRDFNTSHLPYAMNRMGGRIEYDPVKKESHINVFIDRSQTTGEVEEYTGEFIDINNTIYVNKRGYVDCPDINCDMTPQNLNDPPTTGHLMLLTSKKTGKQLVAFQLVL